MRMFVLLCAVLSLPATAEPPSKIDAVAYQRVVNTAMEYRKKRILKSEEFLSMMREKDVILLDTRSKEAFNQMHLKGAVHLNFSDFTAAKLRKVIPSESSKILIYCNNNIMGRPKEFPMKAVSVALNTQTFTNLYAYGYKNVYELGAFVNVHDGRFEFEGSSTKQ